MPELLAVCEGLLQPAHEELINAGDHLGGEVAFEGQWLAARKDFLGSSAKARKEQSEPEQSCARRK